MVYRSAPAWLVILPLCLRALTPAGYMPGSLADGTPFVPCPIASPGISHFLELGEPVAVPDHAHHDVNDESSGTPWETCPFGAAFAAFAAAPQPVTGLGYEQGIDAVVAPPVLLRPAHSRSFPARGPPVLTLG